jgi:hypothetical protein
MADEALLAMLGYGPPGPLVYTTTGSPPKEKPETLSTFDMGGLRKIRYESPGVRTPPPAKHIRRHPRFKKYKHQLFGLRDYTEYTDQWLIGYDQPALEDFLRRQEAFYGTLTYRELQTLQTYTLYGDRLLNNFLRQQSDRDIEELVNSMLFQDVETPIDYQIVDNYGKLQSLGLNLPPYEKLFIDDEAFDDMLGRMYLSESMRKELIGKINRAECQRIVIRNKAWFSDFKNIKPMVYALFTEIMDIILRAPRPKAPIKVYRGMGSERQTSLTFTAMDFWSTSISPEAAMEFMRGKTHSTNEMCCIHEITVNAGVPCMFLDPISKVAGEMEILMVPSTIYKSGPDVRKKGVYPPAVAGRKPLYVYVTELEAVGIDLESVSYAHLERHWAAQRARAAKRAHRRLKYTAAGTRDPKSARRTARLSAKAGSKRVSPSELPARYSSAQWRKTQKRKGTAAAAGGAGARASATPESGNRYVPLLELTPERSGSE